MLVALIIYIPAVVALQLERKGLVSLSYCLKFIQIVGYLAICAILAQHITVNEQYTNTGQHNLLCCAAAVANFGLHACNKFNTQ